MMGEFVTKWRLTDETQQFLSSLLPEVQQKVVSDFAPRDADRDANAILTKFARGISQAYQGNEEAQGFIAKWSLNAEASQLLMSLDGAAKIKIMNEFAPRDATSDANNIFIRFAQGVAGKSGGKGGFKGAPAPFKGGGGKGFNKGYQGPVQPGLQMWQQQQNQQRFAPAPVALQHHAPVAMQYRQAGAIQSQYLNDPVLLQFAARWNLQDEAQRVLASLGAQAQQKVLQEFSPRDASRDANGIFIKFANGISQNVPQMQRQPAFHQQPQMQKQFHDSSEGEAAYLARWRLGDEAQTAFYGLLPDQQQKVMQEFSPRDTSSDANNIFIRFCQGVARGTSGGKGKGFGRSAPY